MLENNTFANFFTDKMANYYGEWVALATAFFWTFTALLMETASKRIGSLHVNLFRLGLASLFLGVFTLFTRGLFLPVDADIHNLAWLALSGIIGFVIGDYCLFKAYSINGARITMLFTTLAPVFAAIAAWILLGEVLSWSNLLAMLVTLMGIALVVLNRAPKEQGKRQKVKIGYALNGILFAIGAAAGQGVGLVLSKYGMREYNPFAAAHIRVMAGFLGFVLIFTVLRKWKYVPESVKDHTSMRNVALGTITGPVIGVGLSLLAVQHAHVGIAQTLMSLTPVLIIPFAVIFHHERPKVREIIGAIIAVGGVAIFFL